MPRVQNGLYKNANGRVWQYHFKFRGLVYKGSTGCESKTLAKDWLHQYRERLAGQEMGLEAVEVPTLRKLLDLWIAAHVGAVTDKHLRDQEDRVRLHMGPWMDRPADELDSAGLDQGRAVYLAGEGRRSIGGWNQVLRRLRALYRWAVDRGHLGAMPWKPNPGKAQEKSEPVVWPEQVQAFIAAVDRSRSQDAKTAIRLMILLGLREDEALNARWEWMDARTLTYRPGSTKSRKIREIPVPAPLMAYIESRHRRQPCGRILNCERVSGYTRKPIARAGKIIGIEGLHPHRLRATFASAHFEAGTPLSQIQLMLGHQDPRTTLGYIVQRPKAQAAAQDRVYALMMP